MAGITGDRLGMTWGVSRARITGNARGSCVARFMASWKRLQMRLYRISFVAGFAAGFVAGTRAGRERYDQIVKIAKQASEHPAVQQATSSAANQASSLLSTAGQKVADGAPKIASSAMHKAGDHIPLIRQRNGHGNGNGKQPTAKTESGQPHPYTSTSSGPGPANS
jgi:hypothetical protein